MATAKDLMRELWLAIDRRDAAAAELLIHPDARLEMAMAQGRAIEGRDAIMAALRAAWSKVYRLRVDALIELAEDTVTVEGRSRHALPAGGFADSGYTWLCEWRDGMLWRQRLFSTAEEARAAWLGRDDSPSRLTAH
jgi:hypothetical protein